MTKSNAVRKILARHETVFPDDVATEAGCTKPLVFQVIRAMRGEGRMFEAHDVGRRTSYRLLRPEEAEARRGRLKDITEQRERRTEWTRLRQDINNALTTL